MLLVLCMVWMYQGFWADANAKRKEARCAKGRRDVAAVLYQTLRNVLRLARWLAAPGARGGSGRRAGMGGTAGAVARGALETARSWRRCARGAGASHLLQRAS